MPRNATANSIPSGAKNFGHNTPKIAVTITHTIRKAPRRVNKPSKTKTPPINSAKAAAPIQRLAGRMNGRGAGKEVNFENPGPPNEPKTFCAPCPMKEMPSARRSGTVAQLEEVDVSFRSMIAVPFVVKSKPTINLFWVGGLVELSFTPRFSEVFSRRWILTNCFNSF